MTLRERLSEALKTAMRERDAARLSALRLISAAIKDRDIALRGEGRDDGMTEVEILAVLGRMVKQRHDSATVYEEGGRLELAERERAEVAVIEEFLPRPLRPEEIETAVSEAIAELGATSIRDMGRVMALLKARHTGRADFSAVGAMVKTRLG